MRLDSTYIDGIQLYDQFLVHMTQLNKFTFSITTKVHNWNVAVELPSNEDVQRSFIGRCYQQVASYVHTNSTKTKGDCHIYSLPFDFDYFLYRGNSVQGGMFHKVRCLNMRDENPIEYNLIKLISQDFSFLQFLYISNHYPQKEKKYSSTLITFPYLTFLDLQYAHDDYVELFLLKKITHLPRLLNLRMEYKSLTRITNNFTNDATHFNFRTIKYLDVCEPFVRPDNFQEYFPLVRNFINERK